MKEIERFIDIIKLLRSENGCPWDREQTHASLKAACIEEAAEVVCGINILEKTGNSDNLKEELGDLLLQVVMHCRIAEEEGLFSFEDVAKTASEKMIRRHPHVFAGECADNSSQVISRWDEIKKEEKAGKEDIDSELIKAFCESKALIDRAAERKGFKQSFKASSKYSMCSDCEEIFSSDETKSAGNTLCISEHFCDG